MTNGKRNRGVGHALERDLAKKFREIGFEHVVTTRSESRSRDNQGIDLINKDEAENGRLPYNVQAKSINGHVDYAKLLSQIPTVRGVTNVVIHRQTKKNPNGRFIETGKYAIVNLEDFFELIKKLKNLEKENIKLNNALSVMEDTDFNDTNE